MTLLPVRCCRCARVRRVADGDWDMHPGKLAGEVLGECKTCLDASLEGQKRDYWRKYQAVERKKAKGYGPAPEGEDVFSPFRLKNEGKR